jgi:cytochrome c1
MTMRQYGCHGCHKIPGIRGPDIYVGPPLEGFGNRKIIAGVLPHTRENLIRWLRDPLEVSPRTQMPDLDVTEQHAADMAAYLESLE